MGMMSPATESPDSPSAAERYAPVSWVHTVGQRISPDGRYLIIVEERYVDLQAVRQLTLQDEYVRQAYTICQLFSRYVDYRQRQSLCDALLAMLCGGVIEHSVDAAGLPVVNILRNTGQTGLLHLLVGHMSPQKRQTLADSRSFNDLKHLLLQHLRHQGRPISVNSLSVTLRRVVKAYL